MSRQPKRTRILATGTAATGITIRPITREKNGSVWITHLVQGWKENGKWQRRQFAERVDAERFAALKRVEMENKGRARQMVLSPLTESQQEEAFQCIERLGATYSLSEAVDFFLKNHRPPDYTIRLRESLRLYLDDKERDGVRARTLLAIKSVIIQFIKSTDDPWVHEVAPPAVESFLRGLRGKDRTEKASRKTWNNYRNELHAFFAWCCVADAGTNRPFTFRNPVGDVRKFSARQVREDQVAKPATTSPAKVLRMLSVLGRWRGGALVRYFAYAYFSGIRPEELARMAPREAQLVNLKTRTITIPANVSKTRHERHVSISENLARWLENCPGPIIPANFDSMAKKVRKHFSLSHDEARHSFISYHVALNRSIGDAALQAGISESIVRRHYLNLHPREEGDEFFRIVPDAKRRRAVLAAPGKQPEPHLKAI